jgi:hypothetical protein
MYVDYQASVVFRKLAIENCARPIKRHDEKSRGQHQPAHCAKNR